MAQTSSPADESPVVKKVDNDDISTQRSFSCGICFELFTKEKRYPISLSCGHTFCVVCIKRLGPRKSSIVCGICRKHTFSNYKRMGKNIVLLDILEKNDLLEDDANVPNSLNGVNDDISEDIGIVDYFSSSTYELDNWMPHADLEDFYNSIEAARNFLPVSNPSNTEDSHTQQLERLCNEMRGVEHSLISSKITFCEILARARQLFNEINHSANDDIYPPIISEDAIFFRPDDNTSSSIIIDIGRYERERDPIHSVWLEFNQNNEVANAWDDERLSNNYMRRSQNSNNFFCYLCEVNIPMSPSGIRTHVQGRRHRHMLEENSQRNSTLADVESSGENSVIDANLTLDDDNNSNARSGGRRSIRYVDNQLRRNLWDEIGVEGMEDLTISSHDNAFYAPDDWGTSAASENNSGSGGASSSNLRSEVRQIFATNLCDSSNTNLHTAQGSPRTGSASSTNNRRSAQDNRSRNGATYNRRASRGGNASGGNFELGYQRGSETSREGNNAARYGRGGRHNQTANPNNNVNMPGETNHFPCRRQNHRRFNGRSNNNSNNGSGNNTWRHNINSYNDNNWRNHGNRNRNEDNEYQQEEWEW